MSLAGARRLRRVSDACLAALQESTGRPYSAGDNESGAFQPEPHTRIGREKTLRLPAILWARDGTSLAVSLRASKIVSETYRITTRAVTLTEAQTLMSRFMSELRSSGASNLRDVSDVIDQETGTSMQIAFVDIP